MYTILENQEITENQAKPQEIENEITDNHNDNLNGASYQDNETQVENYEDKRGF